MQKLNKEITLEDYLNNSGTQGSEPIYQTKKTRFSKVIYDRNGMREIKEPRIIVLYD